MVTQIRYGIYTVFYNTTPIPGYTVFNVVRCELVFINCLLNNALKISEAAFTYYIHPHACSTVNAANIKELQNKAEKKLLLLDKRDVKRETVMRLLEVKSFANEAGV